MNILHVTSSARGAASYSNRVAAEVLAELQRREPGSAVTTRDLARDPLAHIDDDFVAATKSPAGPQTESQRRQLAQSDALVDELLTFSPLAQRTAKKLLNDTEDSTLAIAIELEGHCCSRLRQSDDFKEGVEAFHGKRPAKFKGS